MATKFDKSRNKESSKAKANDDSGSQKINEKENSNTSQLEENNNDNQELSRNSQSSEDDSNKQTSSGSFFVDTSQTSEDLSGINNRRNNSNNNSQSNSNSSFQRPDGSTRDSNFISVDQSQNTPSIKSSDRLFDDDSNSNNSLIGGGLNNGLGSSSRFTKSNRQQEDFNTTNKNPNEAPTSIELLNVVSGIEETNGDFSGLIYSDLKVADIKLRMLLMTLIY